MAASILKIFGDPKGALEALKKVQKAAKDTSSQVKGSFGKLNGVFSKVFSPLGFGLGGLGITTMLTTMVNRFDEIGKAAANMGVSAKYFQQIRFAAERTGTSVDQVREAFSKVQMQVGRFLTGDAAAGSLMAKLGLTREDLAGLNAEDTFNKVNAALRGIADEQTRNAVASQLYGETFQKLNNFLRDYISLGEEAESRGLIVNDDAIKAAEELKDAMTNAGTAFAAALGRSGVVELLNTIAQNLDAASNLEKQMNQNGIYKRDTRSGFRKWWESAWFVGDAFAAIDKKLFGMGEEYYTPSPISVHPYQIRATPELLSGIGGEKNLQNYMRAIDSYRRLIPDIKGSEAIYLNNSGSFQELERRYNELQKKRRDQATAEAAAKAEAAAAAKAAAEAEAAAAAEAQKKTDDKIAKLREELKYRQMIAQGMGREAEIQKKLDEMRKAGPVSAEQEAEIRRIIGAQYDLAHPEKAAGAAKSAAAAAVTAGITFPTDSLRRIGGYSGSFNSSNPSLNYLRRSADSLDTLKKTTEQIKQTLDESADNGAVFP